MKQEDLFNSLSEHFESKAADLGDTEELTEANIVIPEESDYVDFGEDTEEVDVASLWENIRKKKEREGKNYRPAKPGDKDRPSQEALKRAQAIAVADVVFEIPISPSINKSHFFGTELYPICIADKVSLGFIAFSSEKSFVGFLRFIGITDSAIFDNLHN